MQNLLFKSDLFFTDQPDEQIDQWRVGADCIGWLYARLLPVPEIQEGTSPGMEDWGWYATVFANEIKFELSLYEMREDDCEYWILNIKPLKKLLRKIPKEAISQAMQILTDALTNIVDTSPYFHAYTWSNKDPFSKGFTANDVEWIEAK